MKLEKKGLLSDCKSLLLPLSADVEGSLRGGFAGITSNGVMASDYNRECFNDSSCGGAREENGSCTNQECGNATCSNDVCINRACRNEGCPNNACENITKAPTTTLAATSPCLLLSGIL